MKTELNKKILIIGGGFLGLKTVQRLHRSVKNYANITLITETDYFTFYPHLYASIGKDSHTDIYFPLNHILPDEINVVIDQVTSFNFEQKKVFCEQKSFDFDYLIFAGGGKPYPLPENACDMNGCHIRIGDRKEYINFSNQLSDILKSDNDQNVHFHIVGGGITGVEFACSIDALFKNRKNISYSIEILERSPRILSRLLPKTSEVVSNFLKNNQMHIQEGVNINEEKPLFDHTHKDTTFIVWSAGVQNNSLLLQFDASLINPTDKKAIINEHMELLPNIFVGGDMASSDHTGLAQGALRDSVTISNRISNLIKNTPNKSHLAIHFPSVFVIPLSSNYGVMEIKNTTIYGFLPIVLRYVADINFIIGFIKIRYVLGYIVRLF